MPAATKPASIDRLEEAARAAEIREREFRASVAAEIARLERERQFAYRRLDLARALATACREAKTAEAAQTTGAAVLKRELGWHTETEPRKKVLAAWQPVVAAVWREVAPLDAALPPENAPPSLEAEFAAFERWYEATFGQPFLAHFDVELPELPVVEF